jgi:putative transposase
MSNAPLSNGKQHRFDYRGTHRYLITLPVSLSREVFTTRERVVRVLDVLREACWAHRFDVYAYCFLPDRLLLIVRGRAEESDMRLFLREFRERSSAALAAELDHSLWKRTYLERVLRKTEESRHIALDLFQLPVKAGLATDPESYPFQGSFVVSLLSSTGKSRTPRRSSST